MNRPSINNFPRHTSVVKWFSMWSLCYGINSETRETRHALSGNPYCRGKGKSIKNYECVYVFLPYISGMQTASFLCSMWSPVARLAVSYFSKFSHKQKDYLKKKIFESKIWYFLLSLQLLCETSRIVSTRRDIAINVYKVYVCKVPLTLARF